MIDDIEFLVNETMRNKVDNREFLFTDSFQLSTEQDPHVEQIKDEVPLAGGVIYTIQKNASTFIVRLIASDNLSEDFKLIQSTPEDYPRLRLISEGQADLTGLRFFETEIAAHNKAIVRELSNKRFPFYEETLCNISDPGFTWWMSDDEHSMEVYFSLSHTHDLSQFKKIGPLGDTRVATENFRNFYLFFSSLFPIGEFSVGRSHFKISALPEKVELFRDLVEVFKTGDISLELMLRLEEVERMLQNHQINSFTSAKNYLLELAAVRRFWGKIQDELVSIPF
jgi:hypothetical protein